jgi:hypothetical protein
MKNLWRMVLILMMLGLAIGSQGWAADFTHRDPLSGDHAFWDENGAWQEAGKPGADDTAKLYKSINLGYYDNGNVWEDQEIGQLHLLSNGVDSDSSGQVNMRGQTLTINNGGIWKRGSFEGFWGAGVVESYGEMILQNSDETDPIKRWNDTKHKISNGTVFNNRGVITHTSDRSLQLSGSYTVGSTLNNYGIYHLAGTGTIVDSNNGPQMVNNRGILRKTSSGDMVLAADFENHTEGTIIVEAGSLDLSQSKNLNTGILSGGKFIVKNGSAITLPSNGGVIKTNAADVELDGSGSKIAHRTSTGTLTSIDQSLRVNQGTLTIKNGRNFNTAGNFKNSGTLNIGANSTFGIGDGFFYTQTSTGIITGTGTFEGNLINDGTVGPGNSPGVLTISGDYTQGIDGLLDIELAGLTDYDVLDISGSASLDGSLNVSFLNNYTPNTGDVFDILWAESISGVFTLSSDLQNLFNISYDNFDTQSNRYYVQLEYIHGQGTGQDPVPEPGTMMLFGMGLLGLARISRKKG